MVHHLRLAKKLVNRRGLKVTDIIACLDQARDVINIESNHTWRHITLTVRTEGKFRHAAEIGRRGMSLLWRRRLRGAHAAAFAVLQAGPKSGNIHVHVLHYGPWIDQRELCELWTKLTTNSSIVDVRSIGGPKKLAERLSYVTSFDRMRPRLRVKVWGELRGIRRIESYGALRRQRGTNERSSADLHARPPVARTRRVIRARSKPLKDVRTRLVSRPKHGTRSRGRVRRVLVRSDIGAT